MNKNDQEFLVQKIRTQYTEKDPFAEILISSSCNTVPS